MDGLKSETDRSNDMSFEAVTARLTRHILHESNGNLLVSCRAADVRRIIEIADNTNRAPALLAEVKELRERITKAHKLLQVEDDGF